MWAENISGGIELRNLAGTGGTQEARGEVLVLKDDPGPHKPTPCPGPILHGFPAPEPWLGCSCCWPHTHTHTHIHTRAHTSLLFILILRDALGIGPNRQMACFLLLLCLSIFCFPTSCDEGGNHAPHCILIRLDVLKEEREWAKRSPLYFSWATTLPDKCSSFPRACTPIDFPSIRIPQALPAS